ncbi:hypothetical protein H0H92_002003 [Tricholoma furcatifolium]|nr:hypothetical protein H0H92_002003 [Tricholoma furcatifolium]
MLSAFKLKPYDLEPVFASWTDGPRFEGNSKKDIPVNEWLDKIKAGCEERKIPEEYWYKVAQHFMGPQAKARLDELKAVIVKVNGGKYRWSWKKFRVAMESMGWGIETTQKETIKVSKSTGSWWIRKKPSKESADADDSEPPSLSRSTSFWVKKGSEKSSPSRSNTAPSFNSEKSSADATESDNLRRVPTRSKSDLWILRRKSQEAAEERPPLPPKSNSEMAVVSTASISPTPSRSNTIDSGATNNTITEAPLWLLNACNALEYITGEHPKAMSIISAILITAGSIPAIPAIAGGAGGAVLASGAAHAIGAIAVGVGQALSMSVAHQTQNNQQIQASSSTR